MKTLNLMSGIALTALSALAPMGAHAAPATPVVGEGYVCVVTLFNDAYYGAGDHGYISLDIYDQPGCRGAQIAFGNIYSTNSIYGTETARYSEAALMAIFTALNASREKGSKVRYDYTYPSEPGSAPYYSYVRFGVE